MPLHFSPKATERNCARRLRKHFDNKEAAEYPSESAEKYGDSRYRTRGVALAPLQRCVITEDTWTSQFGSFDRKLPSFEVVSGYS